MNGWVDGILRYFDLNFKDPPEMTDVNHDVCSMKTSCITEWRQDTVCSPVSSSVRFGAAVIWWAAVRRSTCMDFTSSWRLLQDETTRWPGSAQWVLMSAAEVHCGGSGLLNYFIMIVKWLKLRISSQQWIKGAGVIGLIEPSENSEPLSSSCWLYGLNDFELLE